MAINTLDYATANYLVPLDGTTHTVAMSGVASATPQIIDWNTFSVNNFPFVPQGAFVDNTGGSGTLTLTILPLGFNVTIPAGTSRVVGWPAPKTQQTQITGSGAFTIFFVDYPVFTSDAAAAAGNSTVYIGNTPVPVSESTLDGIVSSSYAAQGITSHLGAIGMTAVAGTISGTGTSVALTPPANSNLRKLLLSLSENATLATAGIDTITATLNGVQIFSEGIYIPAAAVSGVGLAYHRNIEFESIAANAGATGNLTVAIDTALATGQLNVNAYFD